MHALCGNGEGGPRGPRAVTCHAARGVALPAGAKAANRAADAAAIATKRAAANR